MHSFAFISPREPLQQLTMEPSEPGESQVRVRIEACGLGLNDWSIAMLDALPKSPLVPGAEAVGVVEAVGPEARFVVGQRVGVTPLASSCGSCASCQAGVAVWCEAAKLHAFHVDGALATHGVFADQHLVPLDGALTATQLAPMLGSGWTALSAVEAAGVERGTTLGVWGLGGVGHLVVRAAQQEGAVVFVHDADPERQTFGESLGAAPLATRKLVDAAVVCTPSAQALQAAVRVVRRGGVVVVAGTAPGTRIDLTSMDVVSRGVKLVGVFLGSSAALERGVQLAEAGLVLPTVKVLPMSDAPLALYNLRDAGFSGRLVFVP